MLSDRRQRVLIALIEEYISRALPVGSRTLTERYHLGVSPATVRNELSALEEAGYITQPHTSSGRVPTDAGYRAFVDDLIASGRLDSSADESLIQSMRESASALDDLMEQTSRALSRLTDCLSVVVSPSVVTVTIRQVSFISLSPYLVLIVIVTEDGQVFNRQIGFSDEITPEQLRSAEEVLGHFTTGRALADMLALFEQAAKTTPFDPLILRLVDEIAACLNAASPSRARKGGLSALLAKPEFTHAQTLLPIMSVLEDDVVLVHLLDEALLTPSELLVRIGSENADESLTGVSLVATQFGRGDATGIVAVIGPTRMDYRRAIRAVRAASAALQDD